MRREPPPSNGAREAKLIEFFGIVIGDTARENLPFPGICRRLKPLQLAHAFKQAALAQ